MMITPNNLLILVIFFCAVDIGPALRINDPAKEFYNHLQQGNQKLVIPVCTDVISNEFGNGNVERAINESGQNNEGHRGYELSDRSTESHDRGLGTESYENMQHHNKESSNDNKHHELSKEDYKSGKGGRGNVNNKHRKDNSESVGHHSQEKGGFSTESYENVQYQNKKSSNDNNHGLLSKEDHKSGKGGSGIDNNKHGKDNKEPEDHWKGGFSTESYENVQHHNKESSNDNNHHELSKEDHKTGKGGSGIDNNKHGKDNKEPRDHWKGGFSTESYENVQHHNEESSNDNNHHELSKEDHKSGKGGSGIDNNKHGKDNKEPEDHWKRGFSTESYENVQHHNKESSNDNNHHGLGKEDHKSGKGGSGIDNNKQGKDNKEPGDHEKGGFSTESYVSVQDHNKESSNDNNYGLLSKEDHKSGNGRSKSDNNKNSKDNKGSASSSNHEKGGHSTESHQNEENHYGDTSTDNDQHNKKSNADFDHQSETDNGRNTETRNSQKIQFQIEITGTIEGFVTIPTNILIKGFEMFKSRIETAEISFTDIIKKQVDRGTPVRQAINTFTGFTTKIDNFARSLIMTPVQTSITKMKTQIVNVINKAVERIDQLDKCAEDQKKFNGISQDPWSSITTCITDNSDRFKNAFVELSDVLNINETVSFVESLPNQIEECSAAFKGWFGAIKATDCFNAFGASVAAKTTKLSLQYTKAGLNAASSVTDISTEISGCISRNITDLVNQYTRAGINIQKCYLEL